MSDRIAVTINTEFLRGVREAAGYAEGLYGDVFGDDIVAAVVMDEISRIEEED